ncbi:MAG TPA: TPM domain-containing protein [Gemmatimonadales bacterium]|nr:TPM domain-containing protein [Gemmatimonadales bacterium]
MSATRRKATATVAVLQLMVAAQGLAQASDIKSLFPAQPTGYVTDAASLLAPATRDSLDDLLTRLRAASGAEVAVVTLPTIDDRDEAEVALAIGRAWGVGARAQIGDQRRNAGLVLLLVPRQNHEAGTGHVRIEVGQGLEGVVTDATAGTIRRDVMGPLLAQEQYDSATKIGVRVLTGVIARGFGVTDSSLASTPLPATGASGSGSDLLSLLPLLIFILFALLASRGRRRRGVYWGVGPWIGGGWGGGGFGGGGGGFGGGGFGGFGGGGGFSGGGSGGRF